MEACHAFDAIQIRTATPRTSGSLNQAVLALAEECESCCWHSANLTALELCAVRDVSPVIQGLSVFSVVSYGPV
jgi:hypothetical protein